MDHIDIPELKIYLNIYDLNDFNGCLHSMGLGAYHTGIQFFDTEFAFGFHEGAHSGVYESEPKKSYQGNFRGSIYMGVSQLSVENILDAIEELKIEYIGNSYNIFTKNCNHFTNDLCLKLTNKPIPSYINRLANISYYVRCFFPKSFVAGTNHVPKKSRHRKMDSINLNSRRILKKKEKRSEMESLSQVERLALANHDEKVESSMV